MSCPFEPWLCAHAEVGMVLPSFQKKFFFAV